MNFKGLITHRYKLKIPLSILLTLVWDFLLMFWIERIAVCTLIKPVIPEDGYLSIFSPCMQLVSFPTHILQLMVFTMVPFIISYLILSFILRKKK